MAKAFGKIKRFIGKKDKSGGDKETSATPNSTPTRNADVLKPTVVHLVDAAEPVNNVTAGAGGMPLGSGSHTGADDVLDGILQDLNIKVGQLAVDAEKTDTVSEYSGGSAKSVESSDSDSDDSDEETDEDEETEEEEEEEEEGEEVPQTSQHSVGARVDAVVAAAEEIRKKKGASPPSQPEDSGRGTPASAARGGATPPTEPPASMASREQDSRAASRPGGSRAGGSRASAKMSQSQSQSQSQSHSGSKKRQKSMRKSPVKELLDKPKSGSSSPQFSPEIKSGGGNHHASRSDDNNKSFDTRDDCDHTKSTEISEEDDRTYGDSKEDDTLGENNTLGTNEESYDEEEHGAGRERVDVSASDSQAEQSTFDEDEGRMHTKKTVMNKDIIIHQPGGPSSLVVRAMYYTPLPASPDDIIIKVEASTVSFRDCLLRRDIGIDKVSFPFVPGCEVVGRISNIGKAARLEGYRVGDRVVGLTRRGGGNGYYAKFSTRNVAPIISTKIDAADAVCLVDVYMTAYQALRVGKKDGTPLTDANVLITDGFSPVGQAAVTLAKLEGANVYVTTTESRQDDYMKSLGVKCLPLAPSKWLHKLKGKMDIVVDNTCFDSYDSSWKALNSKGILICTGMTSIYSFQDFGVGGGGCACDAFGDMRDYQAKWAALKARYMMSQTKFHDLWESFQANPKKYQQELKYLCFLVESGTLKPKIAERVSIEEIPDAQRYLETGKANGTIVCLP
mmetsp:Transcript_22151/g.47617  ORF Transcript_22151/g.47617 Transcript_22151/m.47617 type:complete len:733 (-) Transcript_22151:203-2401(-)|eukprot:CAMPEP_0172555364 /NCGR_PEP_ID=MMETSP1067-20121228/58377_1 /TAXON_ID=265564 ORGANISM="Thalassiosira punctigera, Strain Tpunct2005C2" /NCGR_SAMPLE_ID=MMETSP1067 /ASSEMBLY_ACC=CAM_ASM_000444 /LENGTH=732 /DNA_ID=CAMNT_0013343879 /DNA_START=176 /DNA_END=2374 /DNA_ORIENTATION=-